MNTGSHHGDPSLTLYELETCVELVKWIKNGLPRWLPSADAIKEWSKNQNASTMAVRGLISDRQIKTCNDMVRWIRIARAERYDKLGDSPNWLPQISDLLKSRLFWRLRDGKDPLPHPPPTAYSCPWYELIEDGRAHWAYDCFVHKPGEAGLWGRYEVPIANIGQCPYEVLTWSDKEETIPFSVSYGPYLFRTFYGPFETHQFDSETKTVSRITINGWWIKYVSDPTAEGAFDMKDEELPYKIGQSRD